MGVNWAGEAGNAIFSGKAKAAKAARSVARGQKFVRKRQRHIVAAVSGTGMDRSIVRPMSCSIAGITAAKVCCRR
jgi:hypothetical protein